MTYYINATMQKHNIYPTETNAYCRYSKSGIQRNEEWNHQNKPQIEQKKGWPIPASPEMPLM